MISVHNSFYRDIKSTIKILKSFHDFKCFYFNQSQQISKNLIFILFILFIFVIHSSTLIYSYDSPPLNQVLADNQLISNSLFHDDVSHDLMEGEIGYVSGNINLFLLSPSIDDKIPSDRGVFLFWGSKFSIHDVSGCGDKYESENISYILNFLSQQ